jgi:hypothetical protein
LKYIKHVSRKSKQEEPIEGDVVRGLFPVSP